MASYQAREFSTVLRTLCERSGKSKYRMAEISGLDEGYLGKLEAGKRRRPARDTVVKIALALVQNSTEVTIHDVNELLLSAEYAPLLSRGDSISVN